MAQHYPKTNPTALGRLPTTRRPQPACAIAPACCDEVDGASVRTKLVVTTAPIRKAQAHDYPDRRSQCNPFTAREAASPAEQQTITPGATPLSLPHLAVSPRSWLDLRPP